LVDVVRGENPAPAPENRELDLAYSDLPDDHAISVLPLADILGSKWGMLDERDEPRDLFDVWFALTQASVTFDDLARWSSGKVWIRPHPSVPYPG
jgi:hypothetical protein